MKRTVRTAILTLAVISILMVCMTTFSYAGGFGVGLSTPENLTATNVETGVYLTWDKSPEADGYRVYRRLPEQRYADTVGETDGTDNTVFIDKTAESGKKYEYTVRAIKNIFSSRLSENKVIMRLSEPVPESVSSGDGCVNLVWKKTTGAEGYLIYRKNLKNIERIGEVKGENVCHFADSDVEELKSYVYTVIAYNGESISSHYYKSSEPFIANPKITSVKNTRMGITVKWEKPKYATSYEIYKKAVGQENWVKLKTLSSKTDTFTDCDVKSGEVYSYTARTVYRQNRSGYNANGFSLQRLEIPENLCVKNFDDGILVSWNAVYGATSYNVYRAHNGKTEIAGNTSQPSFFDGNVENGEMYKYCVRAVGNAPDMLSGSTAGHSQLVIKKPTEVTAVSLFDGIKINWEKCDSATGYAVFRRNTAEEKWTKIKTVNSSGTTTATDRNVKKDGIYMYTVQPINGKTAGSFDSQGVTVRFVPPFGIKARLSPKGVVLEWGTAPDCKGYEIYRNSGDGWIKTATFGSNETGCIDGSPVYGKENSYIVRVLHSDGYADSTVSSVFGIDPKKPMVALTFDDGPNPDVTNRILDKLSKYNSRATFFVVGERVNGYADCLKRAVSLKCEIGNHTYHHKNLTKADSDGIMNEINSTNTAVENITGISPVVARAPGGSLNDTARANAGMPFIFWSIDTLDWKHRNAESVIKTVKNEVKDGSIVLMHDLYNSTGDAVDTLVPWLCENGYQLVTVSEMMAVKGIDMEDGKTYVSGS